MIVGAWVFGFAAVACLALSAASMAKTQQRSRFDWFAAVFAIVALVCLAVTLGPDPTGIPPTEVEPVEYIP